MNMASAMIGKMLTVLKNYPDLADVTLTTAYESDIKPYPVTKPILAFSVKKVTAGARQYIVNEDGSEELSKNRQVDAVYKVDIFVPYESGATECFRLFDLLYSYLLFSTDLQITNCHCYDSEYVRDCGALVLETDFTISLTLDA